MDSAKEVTLAGARAVAPILLGVVPFGLITGVSTIAAGVPTASALGMSVLVFAGMAQLAVVELLARSAPAAVIVATALVVNLRFVMYSASLAPHFRQLPFRWKGPLAYLLSDQAYAVSMVRFGDGLAEPQRKWFFLGAGAALWSAWQASFTTGVLVGARVPSAWSLDFAVPLTLLALLPSLVRDGFLLFTAIVAGAAAILAASLPLNLGVIVAVLAGVAGGTLLEGRSR